MIRVQCPHCKKPYRTEMEAFGRVAVCTRCSSSFSIGESRPPFQWRPTDLAEDSWIGVAPPEEKPELRHCIICDAPLQPDQVRCPACGANQVTGVVHRAKPQLETQHTRVGPVIPLRLVIIIAVFGLIAAGGYWMILAIGRSVGKVGDELVDQRLVGTAARQLRDSGDEFAVATAYRGKVKDTNLPRFVQMLSAGDETIRRAAALLIGAGEATQLGPVLEWVKAHPAEEQNLNVLHAIGARRLVELSGHTEASVRSVAAEALCLLSQLPPDETTMQELAEAVPAAEKIDRLNKRCRPWPEAVGGFAVQVNETPATFPATVEQIGRTFYLHLGGYDFASLPGRQREFVIPIEYWCTATSPAIDPARLREQLTGTVTLTSSLGIGWTGAIDARLKRSMHTLPGFLPMDPPKPGQALQGTIRFRRER